MPSPESMSVLEAATDAELVAATLAGDRRAFGRIVERYQRLLCSLAYSATGELSESEDLAQEALVDGWRQLAGLREPEKLRAWLCGILRFKVSRLRRADGREPVRHAGPLEWAGAVQSGDEPTADQAIQQEELALMWKALEQVPEIYREPLVLYYREHRSIEHVAVALDLSEDAVKQRLSRGRKILQEQVLAFVESALARSTPGKLFTMSVLAALPALGTPTTAHAAVVGAGVAVHGSMLAKSTLFATLFASFSGVASAILSLRAGLDQSRTPRERRATVKAVVAFIGGVNGWLFCLWLLRAGSWRWWDQRLVFAVLTQIMVVGFMVVWPVGMLRMLRHMRWLRSTERQAHPELFLDARDQVGSSAGEYRSQWALFSVPLIHLRFSSPDEGEPPVFGWIAGGDRAYGLLIAWGAYAVAPVSVGAVSIGIVAIGNFSAGVISFGTIALGGLAIGCASIGLKAYAWMSATGWHSALSGGFSIAHTVAEGPVALAAHANDAAARAMLANPATEQHSFFLISLTTVLSVLPIVYYARAVRQRLGRKKKAD
ncbi:MAG: RNA polymerase sigma factor [Lacunisphaera sp.]